MVTYGLLATLLSLAAFFLVQFFKGKKINLGFISPSFLMISFTLILTLYLYIKKTNIDFFKSFFLPKNLSLVRNQTTVFFALILIGIFCLYFFFRLGKNIIFTSTYFVLLLIGLFTISYQRNLFISSQSPETTPFIEPKNIERRITLIGMEGLSFEFLIPLINQQKLPNFAWLMEEGSWGRLSTFTPNEAFILNNSFSTGKLPSKHRKISYFKYYIPNLEYELFAVPRFIFFRQLTRIGLLVPSPNQLDSDTADIWKIIEFNKGTSLRKDWPYGFQILNPQEETRKNFERFFNELRFDGNFIVSVLRQSFYRDSEFENKASQEKVKKQPHLFSLMLSGLNRVESYFYKFSFPEFFGEVSHEEISKYQSVIDTYYKFYDQVIGKYLASLRDNELLIVYSPHGIEPLPIWKRVVEWSLGNSEITASHELAPDGAVFFFGKEVNKGWNIEEVNIIDITPTLLYYLGLPVAKDMDGIVLSSIFPKSFTSENPVLYINSYQNVVKSKKE